VRVVCVLPTVKGKEGKVKEKRELFFSSDTQQVANDILKIYQARFHIEFCFRERSLQQGLSCRYYRDDDDQMLPAVEDSSLSRSQAYWTVNRVKKRPLTFIGTWPSLP
jgi:hypothetical protein